MKRDYTTHDLRIMREMVESENFTIAEIAQRLDRTYSAIGQQIHKLGLRLRKARYTPEECERILTCDDNELLAREMDRTVMMIVTKRYKLKKAMRMNEPSVDYVNHDSFVKVFEDIVKEREGNHD